MGESVERRMFAQTTLKGGGRVSGRDPTSSKSSTMGTSARQRTMQCDWNACACELAMILAQPQRTALETIPTCYGKPHPQLPD
eukprot:2192768-Pleurochrysis_carterae.AAC.1